MVRTLSGGDAGGDTVVNSGATVMATSVAIERLADNGSDGYAYGYGKSTKPRLKPGSPTGFRRNPSQRKVLVAVSTLPSVCRVRAHDDLIDPRCGQHDAPGTFVIEFDDWDGEGARSIACDKCFADVYRQACMSGSFRPAIAYPLDLDLHRDWAVAS